MSKQKEITLADPKTRSEMAEKEARFLLWCFSKDEARNHIECNLARSEPLTEQDTHEFWKEVKAAFDTIVAGEDDEIKECIHLLDFVNDMKPREQWSIPLLDSIVFKDFRTRLFTIIEDYKKCWIKDKTDTNKDS